MSTRLYVGNIPYTATDEELRQFFSEFGQVTDVAIVTDRETGRPRGFAFVSFATEQAARAAEAANGRQLGGRPVIIKEARERGAGPSEPRGDRPPRRPEGDGGPPRRPPSRDREGGGPPPRPRPVSAVPPEEELEELVREARRRTRTKKKGGRDRDERNQRPRLQEDDEEPRGGANWRHWLDEGE